MSKRPRNNYQPPRDQKGESEPEEETQVAEELEDTNAADNEPEEEIKPEAKTERVKSFTGAYKVKSQPLFQEKPEAPKAQSFKPIPGPGVKGCMVVA